MVVFFLMIRRPPRSTQSRSSAASDVYKRQPLDRAQGLLLAEMVHAFELENRDVVVDLVPWSGYGSIHDAIMSELPDGEPVSYTHLRAHETPEQLVCRLLLDKKKTILLQLSDLH